MITIDLTGKVALVIGGSRGIGAGIVKTFADAGAAVAFTHTGNPAYAAQLGALLDEQRADGHLVTAFACDAQNSKETQNVVDQVLKLYGKIDILVANVGKNIARSVEATTDEDWIQSVDINLSSTFYAVRAVIRPMLDAGGGRIFLIGSSAAFDGGGGSLDYAAMKAALAGMMRYLMKNYSSKKILTNVIHPCVIETDLLKVRYSDSEKKKQLISQVPVGRLGTPDDIGRLAAFLASDFGDFICGQEILVDGGRTFFRPAGT
ncbi:MAG TPA: SDR family NAD(P)-dependent oxidoreductase [Phycisphaerae bacterium]|nr:SDR family NAD(P)-dependent oxidoreductase [Phycisphaerae bacterium]HPS53829.1 SDR family NAD(P)-dependent oxidoreductase [Phycisphaerae bacterium]